MVNIAYLAFAFGVGLAAFANPCGMTVMLAYVSGFFSSRQKAHSLQAKALNGISSGVFSTLGFISLFAVAGAAIGAVSSQITGLIPYLNVLLGAALVLLAYGIHRGRFPSVHIPVGKFELSSPSSFYGFGIVYALASFGCTLPLFLTVVVATLSTSGIINSVSVFLSYSLGMGAAMTVATMGLALSKASVMARLRSIQPYMNRINVLVLALVGTYLIVRNGLFLANVFV